MQLAEGDMVIRSSTGMYIQVVRPRARASSHAFYHFQAEDTACAKAQRQAGA